ncbi:MAG: protein translocase subunit SecF, partial [Bacteroidota bacterium]
CYYFSPRTFYRYANFDQPMDVEQVATSLGAVFVNEQGISEKPEVKTFGGASQLKITTKHLINGAGEGVDADSLVEARLYAGLTEYLPEGTTKAAFDEDHLLDSIMVGPTIADDIKQAAVLSVIFSLLIIFLYILLRFRKWQFGAGALIAMTHDVLVVLAIFSLLYGFLPFSLEIDQAFIAAILTVVGYSINDTVVVFDRIREFLGLYKRKEYDGVVNDALNSTLSRTINTSLSTFVVLLVIFLFGGDVIKGFVFALMIGVLVGTYSSLCVATPIALDFDRGRAEEKRK